MGVEISDEELRSMLQVIKTRYGIDFTNYEIKSLKRGFSRLLTKKKFDSLLDFWGHILKDKSYFANCIDELTVNLTELFRNHELWVMLNQDIIKQFKTRSKVDIWHAGCSSGEEVYSMRIVCDINNMSNRTETLATDLSSTILNKAKQGVYLSVLVQKFIKQVGPFFTSKDLQSYFDFERKMAKVKNSLKERVVFKRHNLVIDNMNQKFDIIFCRNVMIYFDEELKMKVLNLFRQCLNPGGYLIIGYYDLLPEASKELFHVYDAKTRIYQA